MDGIYRVEVVPSTGPDAGKTLQALLLGVGYNPTTGKFHMLFSTVDDGENLIKLAAHDQITRMIIRGRYP